DELGVGAVWLNSNPPDALTILAAAAATTRTVHLATAIAPAFPRHPLVLASQATAVAQLAPGRLTLGVGPQSRATVEGTYRVPHRRPLEYLREYVTVLRAALSGADVHFDGRRLRAHGRLPAGAAVPLVGSAPRAR